MKTKLVLSVGALLAACTLSSCGVAAYPGGYAYGTSYNTRTVGYGNSFYSRPLLLSSFGGGRSYCPQPSFNSGRTVGGSRSHGYSPVTSHGSSRSGGHSPSQPSFSRGSSMPSRSGSSFRPTTVSTPSFGGSRSGSSGRPSSGFSSGGSSRSVAATGGSSHHSTGSSSAGASHRGSRH